MKAYRASFKGAGVTRDTPRAAALAFFAAHPKGRKCHVHEGEADGAFFSIRLGVGSGQRWHDVTPKTAAALPDA